MIKVIYNALLLSGEISGVRCTEELLMKEAFRNPDPDISFEALCPKNYRVDLQFPDLPYRLTRIGIDGSQRLQRIAYEHTMLDGCVSSRGANILHCPAYILPRNRKGLSVVTIHDVSAFDFPEYCSLSNRMYFRFALPQSIRKADKIIAVSRTVKNDILRLFPVNPDKIEVIYPGIDDGFRMEPTLEKKTEVRQKYRLPEKFILFVGNIEPKKNIARLLEAYRILTKRADIPHSLVVAGRFAWKYMDVLQRVFDCKDGRILFPGYIDQSDLPAVYALADIFVFPSLYEGFGIPPLEAMSCGTPVVASNAGALPETTGGNALFADPLSPDAIASAIHTLLHDRDVHQQLAEKGRVHARKFIWEKAWKVTTNLYRSVL